MAAYTEFVIDQNSDFNVTVSLTDSNGDAVNLTGYTLTGKFKKSFASELQYSLDVNSEEPNSGNVVIALSAANSANIEPGKYMFDVGIANSTFTYRVLEGTIIITPSVL